MAVYKGSDLASNVYFGANAIITMYYGTTDVFGYSSQSLSLFTRMTTQPSMARKQRYDVLIRSLINSGVWAKLDALYVFDGDNTQQSFLNIVQNLYNITQTGSGTFTAGVGWAGNGSTGYLNTNFNPSTASSSKFIRDSAYFGIWSNTTGQQASTYAGYFDGTQGVTINGRTTGDGFSARINQAAVLTSTGGTVIDGSGLFGAARSGASANSIRRNAVELTTGTTASTAPANGALRLGNFGTAVYSNLQFKSAIIGGYLTTVEEAALYSALSIFLTGS